MPPADDAALRRGLVIIGAPKASTTAFFDYLAASGLFAVAARKETRHFQSADHPLARRRTTPYRGGLDQYAALFPDFPARPLLEASPDYFYDTGARTALSDVSTEMDALICVCLVRDPVDRLRSMFLFARDTIGTVSPGATLEAYGEDLLAGRHARWASTPLVRDALDVGLYGSHLRPWTAAFGKGLLVVPQEWAVAHPRRLADAVTRQLGLADHAWPDEMSRANATVAPASRLLHRMVRTAARRWPEESRVRRSVRTAYDAVNRRAGGTASEAEGWSPDLRARLETFYREDAVTLLPQITDLVGPDELPAWLTGRPGTPRTARA